MGRRKKPRAIDLLDMNKSQLMRVSREFKDIVDVRRKNLLNQGFSPQEANSRVITTQIARQIKKNKKKIFEI